MTRAISDAWFFRIKAATRDLVARCGGVVRAGEIVNASKSEVSRWQSPGDEGIVPIAAALALEADCGVPLVTAAMADLHGRRLSDLDGEGHSASCLIRDHAALMRQAAEVTAAMAEAMADGTVTAAEAESIDRAAGTLGGGLDQMRRSLAGVRAAPGGKALRAVSS